MKVNLFGGLLLASVLSVAAARPGEGAPPDTQDQVLALTRELRLPDYRQASHAAERAANLPYREVADGLLGVLRNTSVEAGNRSYAFVVKSALVSLGEIAGREDVSSLEATRANVQRLLQNNPASAIIMAEWAKAVEAMNARKRALDYAIPPVEAAPPVPKASPSSKAWARLGRPAPEKVDPENLLPKPELKTLDQLLAGASPDADRRPAILDLLAALQSNLYDAAVTKLGQRFEGTGFQSRVDALEKLLQVMLRRKKSHALLLGKAGIGKTTLVRLLQEGWLRGDFGHPGEHPPIILELSITDVTNPSDPTAIRRRIQAAKALAETLKTHVVLFLDESHVSTPLSRNAVKAFLTEAIDVRSNLVHFIWATTSDEARAFVADKAFSRRWVEVYLPEFEDEEAARAIRATTLPIWKNVHRRKSIALREIHEDTFAFAAKYRRLEQPHAGNPTGLEELLEGAIVYRLRVLEDKSRRGETLEAAEREFELMPEDIRNYLKFQKGLKLIPGDPKFAETFESMWEAFREEFVGQDGAMHQLKTWLRAHFGTLDRDQMLVIADFGPPGAGKSFSAEKLARHFFDDAILSINSGMFSEGDFPLNVLIGSVTGTVGSEEQRSILTRFIKDHPNGGLIVIEEADLLPQQVLDFFVDMITKKEFVDGLGQTWSTANFVVKMNSNVGQDLLVTGKGRSPMTWDEFNTRKAAITERHVVDGRETLVVRPDKLTQVFRQFIARISSRRERDSSDAEKAGMKLERRIEPMYSLLPEREELRRMGHRTVERYVAEKKREYGLEFDVDPETVDRVLALDKYRFEEGYTYVETRLKYDLFSFLNLYLDRKDHRLVVRALDEEVRIGRKTARGTRLVVTDGEAPPDEHSLGIVYGASDNQWFGNPALRERIQKFSRVMPTKVRAMHAQTTYLSELLKAKIIDWNIRLNITLIGTSGNGKTAYGYALAETLFETIDAAYKISGLNSWADLQNHFRSPVGFEGNRQETDFEKWFMSRKNAGGGVIILDELLSFTGLDGAAIAQKIELINKLYDLLDERIIRFGSRTEDARAFIVVITGNSMQELFDHIDDSPEAEQQVRKILEHVSPDDVLKFFRRVGLDAPKIARLGKIFLSGPLPKSETHLVGIKETRKAIADATRELSHLYDVDVEIDPEIIARVVDRVSSVKLGMRHVNAALDRMVRVPVANMLVDLNGASRVEARLVDDRVAWFADGRAVDRFSETIFGRDESHSYAFRDEAPAGARVSTVQVTDLESRLKVRLSADQLGVVATHEIYGHWMTGVLLAGRSPFDFISLVPEGDGLGHVTLRRGDDLDIQGLGYALTQLATLEAGHRAVFLEGIYSFGGGSSGAAREKRDDDQAQVNRLIDAIISNALLENVSEFGKSADVRVAKEFLRRVGKALADYTITYGRRSNVFAQFYEETLRLRYADEDRINAFMASFDSAALRAHDLLLLQGLAHALKVTCKSVIGQPESVRFADLALEVMTKVTREARTIKGLRLREAAASERAELVDQYSSDLLFIDRWRKVVDHSIRHLEPRAAAGCADALENVPRTGPLTPATT